MSKSDILRLDEYLGHIVQATDRVHRYVEDMVELTFLQDEKTQFTATCQGYAPKLRH